MSNFQNGSFGLSSSGVLGANPDLFIETVVQFTDESKADVYLSSSFSLLPMIFTNGNHVTYSEVTEVIPGNGYTTYKYSNHDTGSEYLDTPPLISNEYAPTVPSGSGISGENLAWGRSYLTSRRHWRGLLLESASYSEDNKLTQIVQNVYSNYCPGRARDYIRSIFIYEQNYPGVMAFSKYACALLTNLARPYLLESTTKSYAEDGTNTIDLVKEYKYDINFGLPLEEISIGNDGEIVKNQNVYLGPLLTNSSLNTQNATCMNYYHPYNETPTLSPTTSGELGALHQLYDLGMTHSVIERTELRNGIVTRGNYAK